VSIKTSMYHRRLLASQRIPAASVKSDRSTSQSTVTAAALSSPRPPQTLPLNPTLVFLNSDQSTDIRAVGLLRRPFDRETSNSSQRCLPRFYIYRYRRPAHSSVEADRVILVYLVTFYCLLSVTGTMDNNNQKKECDGNQKTGQGDSNHRDTGWEVKPVRPCKQKRLRMSEARELRRGKKPSPQRPELDFTHNPHLSEKFSTRRDGGNQDQWTSEKDQLARLGLPALGGRGTLEGIGLVPKNPLVAQ